MTIYALDEELFDTFSTDSQVPDSDESNVLVDDLSSAEIYEDQSETDSSSSEDEESREDAVTDLSSYTVVDYTEHLEAIEANTRVTLYVLLVGLALFLLILTYKLYDFLLR